MLFLAPEVDEARGLFERALKATERPSIEELIYYLFYQTDFLVAPASTKYHDCCQGGLLLHSVRVYKKLMTLLKTPELGLNISVEAATIASLLHDVCKAGMYKPCIRHRKVNGRWEDYQAFEVDETFPAGHGEKSVMLIGRFIQISDEEMLAINWHMGGFDARIGNFAAARQLSESMARYPLVYALHCADLMATYDPAAREE